MWKSKGLSNESIKPPATSNNSLNPKLYFFNYPKFQVIFRESCLKTDKAVFRQTKEGICILFLK